MQDSNSHSQLVIQQNVSYYDEIARQYDEILDRDNSNRIIREKVKVVFCKLVPPGLVLDFGGGTGKDLQWLTGNGYRVIFCEPSVNMRKKAISLNYNNIVVLENNASNFVTWENESLFSEKVDAILANFAVVNSIPNLKLLFKNLSLVTKPGGHLLMLVLKNTFKKRWRFNRMAAVYSFFTGSTVVADIEFNQHRQRVYLYTTGRIKKDALLYFHSQGYLFKEHGFILMHFIRK